MEIQHLLNGCVLLGEPSGTSRTTLPNIYQPGAWNFRIRKIRRQDDQEENQSNPMFATAADRYPVQRRISSHNQGEGDSGYG
jgi:hypothetical protein